MKKYLFIFAACSMMLLSCSKGVDAPEENESYEAFTFTACGCGCDQLEDGFIWPKEFPVWYYPVRWWIEEEWIGSAGRHPIEEYQIPEDILSSLSTEDLAELCVVCPLFGPLVGNWNYTIDYAFDNFNGLRELFQRKGAADVLLKLYQERLRNYSFICGLGQPDFHDWYSQAFFCIYMHVLEVLLSRPFPQNDVNYRKILQTYVVSNEVLRVRYQDVYYGESENYFARAHLIIRISPQSIAMFPRKDNNPVFNNGAADQETQDLINKLSYQLIK